MIKTILQSNVIASLISGASLVITAFIGFLYDDILDEKSELERQLKGWQFYEKFYQEAPSDLDFILRNISVNTKYSQGVTIGSPEKMEFYTIQVSKVQPGKKGANGHKEHFVTFSISGTFGANEVISAKTKPIKLTSGTLSEPLRVMNYDFYLYIEKVNFGNVSITFARRENNLKSSNVEYLGNQIYQSGGAVVIDYPPAPDIPPILKSKS